MPSLVNIFPKELREETVKYCPQYALILDFTELFPVTQLQLRCSHRHLMYWAVEHGYFSVFLWAHDHRCNWSPHQCMELAVFNGHLEILQFLYKHGCYLEDKILCQHAAEKGHLEILK